jgi:hypothetical protein
MSTDTKEPVKDLLKTKKTLTDTVYIKPKLFHKPLSSYEKSYIFSYIERLKPLHERDPDIVARKYEF